MHRILREVYRHYTEFEDYVSRTGEHVIEHAYLVYEADEVTVKEQIAVTISFWDLFEGLSKLSRRKQEAVVHNVIFDKLQREVAEEMGITTVSVGQYVDQAMKTLAKRYFAEADSQ
jgi:DNA-directed RNA polymerase specialized sigma24 family protein